MSTIISLTFFLTCQKAGRPMRGSTDLLTRASDNPPVKSINHDVYVGRISSPMVVIILRQTQTLQYVV